MPLIFDKLLTSLGYPLGFGLVVILVSLLLVLSGFKRTGFTFITAAFAMIWVAAMPVTAMALVKTLESQYPAQKVEAYPVSDVAIVLGGGIEQPSATNPYPDLQFASDRLFHAHRILKAGKVKMLLLSGGSVYNPQSGLSEAQAMAELLEQLGVDRSLILIEDRSRNTFENARHVAEIFKAKGFGSGLLVTSANHMPRAMETFRKAGLVLEPASTDINGDNYDDLPFPLTVMPDALSLFLTSATLKEWLGLLVYRWRGWA